MLILQAAYTRIIRSYCVEVDKFFLFDMKIGSVNSSSVFQIVLDNYLFVFLFDGCLLFLGLLQES